MSLDSVLVYVITLNWNHCDDTLDFLASASRLTYVPCRILVVDNASTDGSVAAIAGHYAHVEQIVNDCNLGFAAGINVGIRYALAHGAEWLLLANNDTHFEPDLLDWLVEAAQQEDADLVQPRILYDSEPEEVWLAGGWRRQVTLEIARAQPDRSARSDRPFEVDFVTACGMLMRRRCVESVGLFDERFFMYYEDSDYCLRARAAGCRALVVPQARMWHRVAATIGGVDSPDERYHMALSSVLFFRKHVRNWRWLIVGPYRTGSAIKTVMRLLTARRSRAAWAYLRGLYDGLRR
jgi:GT2 family glycosyltransferase